MARTVSETEVSRPRRVTELGRHHSLGTIAGGFRGLAAAEHAPMRGLGLLIFRKRGRPRSWQGSLYRQRLGPRLSVIVIWASTEGLTSVNQSSLSFVVQPGSILEKQAMVEMQRKTQDITLDTYELTNRIEDIRDDLQKLTSMVGRLANSQLSRVQDAVVRTVEDFEEAIRRNPLSALGIALGLGFLVAIFLRR
jgi:ElaB/YqjD/DUF883 family membrane-anchored ribosome-binding protein